MDQLENMNKDRRCYICSLINPSGVLEVNDSVNIVLKVSTERVTDTLTRSQIWCVSSYITAMALLELVQPPDCHRQLLHSGLELKPSFTNLICK